MTRTRIVTPKSEILIVMQSLDYVYGSENKPPYENVDDWNDDCQS